MRHTRRRAAAGAVREVSTRVTGMGSMIRGNGQRHRAFNCSRLAQAEWSVSARSHGYEYVTVYLDSDANRRSGDDRSCSRGHAYSRVRESRESRGCGGTLARLADEFAVVSAPVSGERGAHTGPARDDALGRTSAREREAAASGNAEVIIAIIGWDLQWAHVTSFHAELVLHRRRKHAAIIRSARRCTGSRPCRRYERTRRLYARWRQAPPTIHVTRRRSVTRSSQQPRSGLTAPQKVSGV